MRWHIMSCRGFDPFNLEIPDTDDLIRHLDYRKVIKQLTLTLLYHNDFTPLWKGVVANSL